MTTAAATKRTAGGMGAGFLLGGVLLPVGAVVVEEWWRVCTEVFFDPLPTFVHAALFLSIAVVNFELWRAARSGRTPSRFVAGPMWGAALAVAIWYSAVFLVISPLSLIGCVVYGLGLLGFAPMTGLLALVRGRVRADEPPRGRLAGAAAGLALLCAADLPAAAAHVAIVRASSPDPETARAAVDFLRTSMPRSTVLAAAAEQPSVMSPVGVVARFEWKWNGDLARDAAWRATGEEAPRGAGSRWFWRDFDDEEQGAPAVGSHVEGLCLGESALDGDVDPVAGVADLGWTLVFRNESNSPAEARATVALPARAVVSDATLWVNGEPREAMFGGRRQTQEAYEKVVRQRRDPLLVTTNGRDRVLVRCFPVPAKGEMKIRLRIAAPLVRSEHQGLQLPHFASRNFDVCRGAKHSFELRGGGNVTSYFEVPFPDLVDGKLRVDGASAAFATQGGGIGFELPAATPSTFAADPFEPGHTIVATRERDVTEPPPLLVVVVDASGAVPDSERDAAAVLLHSSGIPDDTEVAVLAASDTVVDVSGGVVRLDTSARERISGRLKRLPWAGGVDDLPALHAAAGIAASRPGARVLWLHGPQTRFAGSVRGGPDSLDEGLARSRVDIAELTGVRVAPGANVIADSGDRVPGYREELVPPGRSVDDVLRALGGAWYGRAETLGHRYSRGPGAPAGSVAASAAAQRPLAALWAMDDAARLVAERDVSEAVRVAALHRVVTPVTGAVVLETDAEYDAAGLKKVVADEVPTVPEPAEWAAIAVAAAALAVAYVRRRRVRAA